MEERFLTLHPEGKRGVNIDKRKYDAIRRAIIDLLRVNEEMTFTELTEETQRQLEDSFEGSIPWYVTTVKLDLEARDVIERIPSSSPQRLRMVDQ